MKKLWDCAFLILVLGLTAGCGLINDQTVPKQNTELSDSEDFTIKNTTEEQLNGTIESALYFNNLEQQNDKEDESKGQETIQITPYIDDEKRNEIIAAYLQKHDIDKEMPDGTTNDCKRCLIEYYSDEDRRMTCMIFHIWGLYYKDPDALAAAASSFYDLSQEEQDKLSETTLREITYCTTLYWDDINYAGTLIYDCDKEQRTTWESFTDLEGNVLTSLSYDYIEDIPFSFITEYENVETANPYILNRAQCFWLYKDLTEYDETGRWISYHGCLHSGDRAVCSYDENAKLETIREESEEFEEDWGDARSGDITLHYREDGSLERMEYSFVTARRSTYDSSGTAYFDEQGRMVYRTYYVTHGNHECFYLYKDGKRPWAYMELCSQAWSSIDSNTNYGNEFFIYLFEPQ